MAEIVAAFAASHAPPMLFRPEALAVESRERLFGQYRQIGQRLRGTEAQALVLISNEHLQNFFLNNLPAVCIGLAETYSGPAEAWLPLAPRTHQGAAALGDYLLREALDADFDPAFSLDLRLDHGSLLPLHFGDVDPALPLVPILINNVEPPLPTMRRCWQWGQFLGRALRACPHFSRIAVLATGGLSHDVGSPRMGLINEAFDRQFLALLAGDDTSALLRFARDEVQSAGNGAEEIRNWVIAKAIVGDVPLDERFYAAVPEWSGAVGLVEWRVQKGQP